MFDELWQEIQDSPGEIFDLDIPELKEEDDNFDDKSFESFLMTGNDF